ncbi:MAG: hypoxanthine phosphoribosyltransferase [Cyclobacteriaceae bacterium]|nr:hypoxanthine phosphoribosyltransferase [Cyclobacteriaceae bacterium]
MQVKDLEFEKFIDSALITDKVKELAARLNSDYVNKTPVLLPILNGSFMFASDLMKELSIPCRISFVKISSYSGTSSTGQLKTLIGHEENLFNQDILIVEDIIDTGLTIEKIILELRELGAKSVETVSLLRKQVAREKKIDVKYIGFELEYEFVLGYGMDYDGLGRNLKDLYRSIS